MIYNYITLTIVLPIYQISAIIPVIIEAIVN